MFISDGIEGVLGEKSKCWAENVVVKLVYWLSGVFFMILRRLLCKRMRAFLDFGCAVLVCVCAFSLNVLKLAFNRCISFSRSSGVSMSNQGLRGSKRRLADSAIFFVFW